MGKLGISLKTDSCGQTVRHIANPEQTSSKPDREITTLKSKFHKLFTKSHTVKTLKLTHINLKKGAKLTKQKGRPIPIHLQPTVEKEIEKLKS